MALPRFKTSKKIASAPAQQQTISPSAASAATRAKAGMAGEAFKAASTGMLAYQKLKDDKDAAIKKIQDNTDKNTALTTLGEKNANDESELKAEYSKRGNWKGYNEELTGRMTDNYQIEMDNDKISPEVKSYLDTKRAANTASTYATATAFGDKEDIAAGRASELSLHSQEISNITSIEDAVSVKNERMAAYQSGSVFDARTNALMLDKTPRETAEAGVLAEMQKGDYRKLERVLKGENTSPLEKDFVKGLGKKKAIHYLAIAERKNKEMEAIALKVRNKEEKEAIKNAGITGAGTSREDRSKLVAIAGSDSPQKVAAMQALVKIEVVESFMSVPTRDMGSTEFFKQPSDPSDPMSVLAAKQFNETSEESRIMAIDDSLAFRGPNSLLNNRVTTNSQLKTYKDMLAGNGNKNDLYTQMSIAGGSPEKSKNVFSEAANKYPEEFTSFQMAQYLPESVRLQVLAQDTDELAKELKLSEKATDSDMNEAVQKSSGEYLKALDGAMAKRLAARKTIKKYATQLLLRSGNDLSPKQAADQAFEEFSSNIYLGTEKGASMIVPKTEIIGVKGEENLVHVTRALMGKDTNERFYRDEILADVDWSAQKKRLPNGKVVPFEENDIKNFVGDQTDKIVKYVDNSDGKGLTLSYIDATSQKIVVLKNADGTPIVIPISEISGSSGIESKWKDVGQKHKNGYYDTYVQKKFLPSEIKKGWQGRVAKRKLELEALDKAELDIENMSEGDVYEMSDFLGLGR